MRIVLKTLFNIVEAPFNFFFFNFDVCVWWYLDGPINNQEYKIFEIYVVTIKAIYDWLFPLNKQSGLPFILTQQSMGWNE